MYFLIQKGFFTYLKRVQLKKFERLKIGCGCDNYKVLYLSRKTSQADKQSIYSK